MTQIPVVTKKNAEDFSKAWTSKGVAIFFQDVYLEFAADFANVVLRSFVKDCQDQAMAAQKAAQAKKIVVEE